jgi:hypothetical protein
MAEELRKKTTSFGSATIEYFSPSQAEDNPPLKVINLHMTFEEALKLHLGLGQLLAKLNSYHRSFQAAKQAGAEICVYFPQHRIVVREKRLRPKTGGKGAAAGGNGK